MAATLSPVSTPVNKISRDNITVLIMNNILNNSVEFMSDTEIMETDSPIRKPNLQPINKKLFHSPRFEQGPNDTPFKRASVERTRKVKKRKQSLIPDSSEKIKRAYVQECDRDEYSPDHNGGMRKRVLISLFHNKEYSMEIN